MEAEWQRRFELGASEQVERGRIQDEQCSAALRCAHAQQYTFALVPPTWRADEHRLAQREVAVAEALDVAVGDVDFQDVAAGRRAVSREQHAVDEALAGKQFLLGDYTLADAHLGSLLSWVRHMQIDFTPYARLNAWSVRWSARPAVVRLMAQHSAAQ